MNLEKRKNFSWIPIYLLTETVLYLWFMAADTLGCTFLFPSDGIKYLSMILNAFMAVWIWKRYHSTFHMVLAQLLILPADYILLFHAEQTWLGIGFFFCVQLCYKKTVQIKNKKTDKEYFLPALFLSVLFILILRIFFSELLNPETLLAVFYILLFLTNVLESLKIAAGRRGMRDLIFAGGLVLFFLCDIHVGLCYLVNAVGEFGLESWYLKAFAPIAMWMFYLPGQVLLVLSSCLPDTQSHYASTRKVL